MKSLKKFAAMIKDAEHIVLTTHLHPDADGLGAQIALCHAIRKLNKRCWCVNEEKILGRYHYLDPERTVLSHQEYMKIQEGSSSDLFIVLDTHSLTRVGSKVSKLATQTKGNNILFIDHHPAPSAIRAIHCIDTSRAATGELVTALIEELGIELDRTMALPLYTAILIDTSSFRYPSVTAQTHLLLSKLLATGVRPSEAYNFIYGTKKLSYMQLLGHVLSSAQTALDDQIGWLHLSLDLLNQFQIDPEDTHAFINHLLIMDNLKVACMFREVEKDLVKLSLRSTGDVNVASIAESMGGGGHPHSSAAMIHGELNEVIDSTIAKLAAIIRALR